MNGTGASGAAAVCAAAPASDTCNRSAEQLAHMYADGRGIPIWAPKGFVLINGLGSRTESAWVRLVAGGRPFWYGGEEKQEELSENLRAFRLRKNKDEFVGG